MDAIIEFINGALGTVLGFLPNSPFTAYLSAMEQMEWLKWLNWVVPIEQFISIGTAWLACVGIYYVYQVILRWARAVE